MAQALAGAMLSRLSWWIDRGTQTSPEQMDAAVHHLVWCGVNIAATQKPSAPAKFKPRPRMNQAAAEAHALLFK